jgi:hypothetical protein
MMQSHSFANQLNFEIERKNFIWNPSRKCGTIKINISGELVDELNKSFQQTNLLLDSYYIKQDFLISFYPD